MPPEGQGLPPPPTATPTTTTTEQLYPSLPSSVKDGAELKKKDAMSTASVIPSNVHMMPTATQDDNAVVNVGRGLVRRESSAKLSPWRELDSNAFVIAYSVKGTARCGACQSKVAKGELQLGTFYTHEDKFTLVRWHHQRCVAAPECLTHPMDLCGIEDLKEEDLERVFRWLGFEPSASVKSRCYTT